MSGRLHCVQLLDTIERTICDFVEAERIQDYCF